MHPSPLEWVASGVCPWMCSQTRLVPSICGVKIGKKSVGCVYCSSTVDGLAHPRTSVWPSRLVGDLPGLARAPLQGVKKPITHLSPKSIAVSAPLCRNYFCCHVRARVSPGGGKALSRRWEERRDVPPRDGSAAQRDADPHRAAASRLLLSLLCCKCLKHFWRRGGLLIKLPFVEQLAPCNCLFPVPVSKCLLFPSVSHGALLIDGNLFPQQMPSAESLLLFRFCLEESLPQLSCSVSCKPDVSAPQDDGCPSRRVSVLRVSAASPSAGISTPTAPGFIPQKKNVSIHFSLVSKLTCCSAQGFF